jgi:hypothetical protein
MSVLGDSLNKRVLCSLCAYIKAVGYIGQGWVSEKEPSRQLGE